MYEIIESVFDSDFNVEYRLLTDGDHWYVSAYDQVFALNLYRIKFYDEGEARGRYKEVIKDVAE